MLKSALSLLAPNLERKGIGEDISMCAWTDDPKRRAKRMAKVYILLCVVGGCVGCLVWIGTCQSCCVEVVWVVWGMNPGGFFFWRNSRPFYVLKFLLCCLESQRTKRIYAC